MYAMTTEWSQKQHISLKSLHTHTLTRPHGLIPQNTFILILYDFCRTQTNRLKHPNFLGLILQSPVRISTRTPAPLAAAFRGFTKAAHSIIGLVISRSHIRFLSVMFVSWSLTNYITTRRCVY